MTGRHFTDKTIDNGQNDKMEQSSAEKPGIIRVAPEKPASQANDGAAGAGPVQGSGETPEPGKQELEQPEKGFVVEDGKNFFVIKIQVEHGYLAILGFLEECSDFVKAMVRRQQQKAAEQKIVKPKGFGRFNLFKGK